MMIQKLEEGKRTEGCSYSGDREVMFILKKKSVISNLFLTQGQVLKSVHKVNNGIVKISLKKIPSISYFRISLLLPTPYPSFFSLVFLFCSSTVSLLPNLSPSSLNSHVGPPLSPEHHTFHMTISETKIFQFDNRLRASVLA